jgi:hypothetical protein
MAYVRYVWANLSISLTKSGVLQSYILEYGVLICPENSRHKALSTIIQFAALETLNLVDFESADWWINTLMYLFSREKKPLSTRG